MFHINIIGAGLAGCEAALTAVRTARTLGLPLRVRLYDMKPQRFTPAHKNPALAELVCSNSLKNNAPTTACGLLKEELRLLGSSLIAAADRHCVPAGAALAVDREHFSADVTEQIIDDPDIEFISREVDDPRDLPDAAATLISTGPLTADPLDAVALLRDIEKKSRLKCTGIINNSNIGVETDEKILFNSFEYISEVCRISGLPLIFHSTNLNFYKMQNVTKNIWR